MYLSLNIFEIVHCQAKLSLVFLLYIWFTAIFPKLLTNSCTVLKVGFKSHVLFLSLIFVQTPDPLTQIHFPVEKVGKSQTSFYLFMSLIKAVRQRQLEVPVTYIFAFDCTAGNLVSSIKESAVMVILFCTAYRTKMVCIQRCTAWNSSRDPVEPC